MRLACRPEEDVGLAAAGHVERLAGRRALHVVAEVLAKEVRADRAPGSTDEEWS